jgi:hypothetical protein
MTPQSYSQLAAVLFAVMAIAQLLRAAAGWPVTINGYDMPFWPNWLAFLIFAILSVVGFRSARQL